MSTKKMCNVESCEGYVLFVVKWGLQLGRKQLLKEAVEGDEGLFGEGGFNAMSGAKAKTAPSYGCDW